MRLALYSCRKCPCEAFEENVMRKAIFTLLILTVGSQAQSEDKVSGKLNKDVNVAKKVTIKNKDVKDGGAVTNVTIENHNVNKNDNTSKSKSKLSSKENKKKSIQVVASPLEVSRAEELRGLREKTEIATEKKIAERLEQARLQDEKKRAARLFGEKNLKGNASLVVVKESKKNDKSIKEQVLSTIKAFIDKKKKEKGPKFYTGFEFGTLDYHTVRNVEGKRFFGISAGMNLSDSLILGLEGSFAQVKHTNTFFTSSNGFEDIQQFSTMGVFKVAPQMGIFQPYVAGLAGYVYRKHNGPSSSYFTTGSFDAGVMAGVNMHLSKRVTFGVGARYFTSISGKISNSMYDDSVENLDYVVMGINLQAMF